MDRTNYPNIQDFFQISLGSVPTDRPAFLEHLLGIMDKHIAQKGKVLLLALTKRSSEEITNFLIARGYKAYYLHSEIDTLDRWEIIKKLKRGDIDIIVGINLLREGIDLPEVTLIGILDADKEGFLRSTTSLIQIIGRAARNPHSEVVLYADYCTESMLKALWETYRRRHIQEAHNARYGIVPQKATSNVKDLESVKTDEALDQSFGTLRKGKIKKLKRLTKAEKAMIMQDLKKQLDAAIAERRFEDAAIIRDRIKELEGQ